MIAKPTAKIAPTIAKTAKATLATKSAGNVETSATASFESEAPKPRRRTKAEIRTRIYWAVFNQSLKRVAVFEFDQKDEAEKRAGKLAKVAGEHHFVQKIKAIVQ
ncbi:MAG: hypothetical protein U0892_22495 [Pirellulales bacterium]